MIGLQPPSPSSFGGRGKKEKKTPKRAAAGGWVAGKWGLAAAIKTEAGGGGAVGEIEWDPPGPGVKIAVSTSTRIGGLVVFALVIFLVYRSEKEK
ncbi:hypothetical protein Patl1_15167 [Pistacia atlantica]|uniref:Uncharacterized protein n=1 Tax=Pistacia atlantica TaxID=434234 RepID=A0ACC1BAR3_9ROSI|nr:hypothetical protein Patl1_15167 [Pistacia atlantica]